ncbi:mediator complex subunit Med5-domain-containing protein [Phanerochaete sordida]|uniref:Mediator of RNA polymerase II transcription subunit 5 n=1 Tax=Phanerochaete sordida TaxID=48140 RepID=A0A9P3LAK2_9APHY|nr:mediator complex subunit Med5-domain-containing protein [Phanerochaete sordida]
MAISELTRNSFQSGLSASKWLSLCKLFISKNLTQLSHPDIESALSNSVLALFSNYPGDPALIAYLRHAIQDGLLSLATFISTFLSAARSIELRNVSTLDTLCRLALDCHYASGMPPMGSIVSFTQSLPVVFSTVLDATALLRTAHDLPQTHLHQLTNTASELLILLLSTIGDVSQIPVPLGMMFLQDMVEMTHTGFRLTPTTRHVLDQFTFALHNSIGDDASNETQMVHTFQLSFGKADAVSGPSSGKDIITCGLLLHNMVTHRGGPFSSGDGRRAVVLLVAVVRWTAWTPATFYTQLMQSAVACFAQAAANPTSRNAALWRAFVVGRLPHLLVLFEKSVELDGVSESDWRSAMQIAVTSLFQRSDLLSTCDSIYHRPSGDQGSNGSSSGPTQPFMSELLHQLLTVKLLDQTVVTTINPNLQNDFHPRMQTEAQEHSSDLEAYMELRFNTDMNVEDARPILNKIWKDPCSHATFANVAKKRFKSYSTANDIESLGHMCKILYSHESSLEILSLHVTIQDLLCRALAIIEDYDCETVGDPQAAVTHYGSVVLFVQTAFTKYNLWNLKFTLGERTLSTDLLHFAAYRHQPDELKGEDEKALKSWYKTLFDAGSEGIDDSILRNTRPHSLLRVAATLLIMSINACANEKLDKEALNNGVSYFQGPLLNWTLVGVVKALLRDIKYKLGVFNPTIPLAILRTIIETPSCPRPVLKLSAHKILRTFPLTPSPFEQNVDRMPYRKVALEVLGYPPDEPLASRNPSQPEDQSAKPQPDPVATAIRACVTDARAGKAPALDVEWCLLFAPPVRFLAVLWDELVLAAKMGELEAPRRLLPAVLSTPRAPHSPPLLPVFLHVVLPQVVTAADALPPAEQPLVAELAAGTVSGALTAALFVEWALLSVCKEQRLVLGQPALTMARRLSGELKRRPHSPTSTLIMQRLGASPSFMANFPTFMTE